MSTDSLEQLEQLRTRYAQLGNRLVMLSGAIATISACGLYYSAITPGIPSYVTVVFIFGVVIAPVFCWMYYVDTQRELRNIDDAITAERRRTST